MDVWCNGQNIETAVSITAADTDLLCNKGYFTEFKKTLVNFAVNENQNTDLLKSALKTLKRLRAESL